ncbi:hypothetical protein P7K49_017349, partial [Saguinus oedipus]
DASKVKPANTALWRGRFGRRHFGRRRSRTRHGTHWSGRPAPGAPVRESNFKLAEREGERERTDSEAGSWVIGLSESHPHRDKHGNDWRCLALRVLLPASRTVQP